MKLFNLLTFCLSGSVLLQKTFSKTQTVDKPDNNVCLFDNTGVSDCILTSDSSPKIEIDEVKKQFRLKLTPHGSVTEENMSHIENLLIENMESSPSEMCKVKELLEWKDFKIILYKGKERSSVGIPTEMIGSIANYDLLNKSIFICVDYQDYLIKYTLTHELNHALDSLNNLKNKVNQFKLPNGDLSSFSLFCGWDRVINPNQNRNLDFITAVDCEKNLNLIQADIDSSIILLKKPFNKLPLPLKEIVVKLKENNYQLMKYRDKITHDDKDLITKIKNAIQLKGIVKLIVNNEPRWLSSILENGEFDFTLTDPNKPKTLNYIQQDIVKNLQRLRKHIPNEYGIINHTSEYNAFLSQYYAPYPELEKTIFKNLMEIRTIRDSTSMKECLDKNNAPRRLLMKA